jgi:predicted dehydrogenase
LFDGLSVVVKKLRWGVMGTAKVARNRVIPAFAEAPNCELVAIASRDYEKARLLADLYQVPYAYGSYEALLADPTIDTIYLPLPNSLHAHWASAALRAGKNVLCEKPLACNADEARMLMEVAQETGRHLQEALAIFGHPQWQAVRAILDSGKLGDLRAIHSQFSFHNEDPDNIRNAPSLGGGGLLDLGCYSVAIMSWIMRVPPHRVMAELDHDARFGVDRSGAAFLDFDGVRGAFSYSMQSAYRQQLSIFGTTARLELELPFTPPAREECLLKIFGSANLGREQLDLVRIQPCNQFTASLKFFAAQVLHGTPSPLLSLEQSVANLRVLDAIRLSAASGHVESVST